MSEPGLYRSNCPPEEYARTSLNTDLDSYLSRSTSYHQNSTQPNTMSKRLVTVFGATGNQGGAVIKQFLGHPTLSQKFTLRGITRNTSSPKAQALASQGVDLVVADLNNPESLTEALQGSYAVFAMTNYWETGVKATEVKQGKAIADACVATGVKHAVWSSLPNVTELTKGHLKKVEHFDGKHEISEYFEQVKGKSSMITTYFMPGFYMSNFQSMVKSNPQVNDGVPTLNMPWDAEKTQVPLLDAAQDTGVFVAGIIGYPEPAELDGRHIQAVSEWITPAKIASDLTSVAGQEVKFNSITPEFMLKVLPNEELVENMVLVGEYSYYGKGAEQQQAESNKVLAPLDLKTESFKEWAQKVSPWKF